MSETLTGFQEIFLKIGVTREVVHRPETDERYHEKELGDIRPEMLMNVAHVKREREMKYSCIYGKLGYFRFSLRHQKSSMYAQALAACDSNTYPLLTFQYW